MPGIVESRVDQGETRDFLLAFRHGDRDAFEWLFRQHQRTVYGWILRIVCNPANAEDLTVETFWRIHQAHARFNPALGFEGWSRRIATRAALDWLRSTHRETASRDELADDLAARSAGDPAISAEIRRKTAQALQSLLPKLRIVAVLVLIEEEPHREIAAALGLSIAAVKVRAFRAVRRLRRNLEEQGIKP